jgi:hypothetical protein
MDYDNPDAALLELTLDLLECRDDPVHLRAPRVGYEKQLPACGCRANHRLMRKSVPEYGKKTAAVTALIVTVGEKVVNAWTRLNTAWTQPSA